MLHIHRSERADRLVEALAGILREPPSDPFAADVIAVPAKGVERWLAQRLSHVLGAPAGRSDGVCAGVVFPAPHVLVEGVLAAVAGITPADDPWRPERLQWAVLDAVDECAGEQWCATLATHLGLRPTGASSDRDAGYRRGRRMATAAHLASLFDSYAAHRPAMIADWARGDDTDGAGARLDPDLGWQATLWREVRSRFGVASPAERLGETCATLRAEPQVVQLPERLSLFGPTRLTTAQLEVLAALAAGRAVHLWLPHPSAALWERLARMPAVTSRRRRDDPTMTLVAYPLLSSLGRDSRELQLRLSSLDCHVSDAHHPVADRPATLLGRLQQALQDDAEPAPAGVGELVPGDRTLQVHACHGRPRQVEVLREVLVGLLAADPTLEPRDILVMCPDIEEFAPLISATFGMNAGSDDTVADDGFERHPGHLLRVRLADRSLRQTNPLLSTIAALLELADGRVTASQVLDLASSAPIRQRFRFNDDDLERLREWVATSGVRWGLDAAHRKRFGLDTVPQNTWWAGLDRLLLGAAMAEDDLRWVGLALPLDDVESNDVDLAGRLAEFVDRLAATLDAMAGQCSLDEWLAVLRDALDALTAVRDDEHWQRRQAMRLLSTFATTAGVHASDAQLSLADVHALLADVVRGRPTRANFRTGNLTMCSMVPMRSVPHRVVCLLGMDDGTFPRGAGVDGDDILARDPCIGERDRRSEDRQLLLDAVLAAQECLAIFYTGADPRTNAPRPPAVPVGEILDAADSVARSADGRRVRDVVVTRHPLQPFDGRNFTPGALGVDGPFSFDRQALLGAEQASRGRRDPEPFLRQPLPPPEAAGDVALTELIGFLEHPARAFLHQRLEVSLAQDEEQTPDSLRVELDPLEQWAVGDRLLKSRLAGAGPTACSEAEWRRGTLPPGELGKRVLESVVAQVEPLVAASGAIRTTEASTVDVSVDIAGRRLTGTVGGIHDQCVLRVEYSRLAPKHRLRAWAQLLSLTVAWPDRTWTAATMGRARYGGVLRSVLGPVDPGLAARHLAMLLTLQLRNLSEPLPMALKTSAAYASARLSGGGANAANAREKAASEWAHDKYGERIDPAYQFVWGERADIATLADPPRCRDETGPDWPADETSRFGALAVAVWRPLVEAESLETV